MARGGFLYQGSNSVDVPKHEHPTLRVTHQLQPQTQKVMLKRNASNVIYISNQSLTSPNANFNSTQNYQEQTRPQSSKLTLETETKIYKLKTKLKTYSNKDSCDFVPCLFIKGRSKKVMIHFHANGEDLSHT